MPSTSATSTAASPAGVRGSDYAALSRQVKAAGLLERRPAYYRLRVGIVLGAYAAGWTVFAVLGSSWWQLAVAAFLAVVFTQVGFLGHDAGHRQVTVSRRRNEVLGILCADLLIGLSYGWWIDKHNRHHAHPNQVDHDPDIADGAIAFTRDQARARTGRFGRLIARQQAVLFFPMLLLEGMALHVASVQALVARPRRVEIVLFVVHVVAYVSAVFLVLPIGQALAFVAVHQGLFGLYMGCAFAPNHKGMPVLDADDDRDFLRRQVLTSRNIRGSRAVDLLLGGLNYQIEHHLFPSMPSAALREVQPLVREFCRTHDLAYAETGLVDSYRQVLGYLRDVGSTAGSGPVEDRV